MENNSFIKAKHVSNYLGQENNILQDIVRNGKTLARLTRMVAKYLDDDLVKHFVVASYSKNKLTLCIDNAAWATRLRYELNNLLQLLKQNNTFASLEEIKLIISKDYYQQRPKSTLQKPSLSEGNANYMQDVASDMVNTKLKNALLRLAKHGKNNKH